MNRGSTPVITFSTPLAADAVSAVSLIFTGKEGNSLIQKNESQLTIGDHTVSVRLSQAETLGLPNGNTVEAQLRLRDTDSVVYVSNIVTIDSERMLGTGII